MGKKNIDIELIEDVLNKFKESEASSLKLEIKNTNIKLKKEIVMQPAPLTIDNSVNTRSCDDDFGSEKSNSNVFIEADRVGKYFSIHPPDSPERLKEGDTIACGERMGHIVSMEVVYDIFAPFDLVVKDIYINDSDPVEYGQALYEVEAI